MDYLAKLQSARTIRNNIINNDIAFFNNAYGELIRIEKAVLAAVIFFNNPSFDKNNPKKIRCYIEYKNLKSKPSVAVIKRLNFHTYSSVNGVDKKVKLSDHWAQNIKQTTEDQYVKERADKRLALVRLVKQYHKITDVLDKVVAYVAEADIPNTHDDRSPYVSPHENEHLQKRILPVANKRTRAVNGTYMLMKSYVPQMERVEAELAKLSANFNHSFIFKGMSLAYSWEFKKTKNPLLTISSNVLWNICKPIDDRGSRSRYKIRVTNLNRDFIRKKSLNRHARKLFKENKPIVEKNKEWLKLKKISRKTHSILKTLRDK